MKAIFRFCQDVLVLLFAACLVQTSFSYADQFRLGIVLDKGGKDDKSFNSSALQGALRVKDELKSFIKYVEATDDNAFEPLLRSLSQKKFDLIISIGLSQVDALKKVASQFPNQHYAIVDGEVNAPNVRSLLFEEQEGSFVVGAIAAMSSKTGKVGFIGGMDIPLIRRFEIGYAAGAKAINPKAKVISNYIGVTADAWNNPPKAKELAVAQYDSGADVIFSAAGASGSGLFDAAEEKKKFAIGVDSNQNWVKPGVVLTSMVKRIDQAVFLVSQDAKQGKFTGGVQRFGLFNQGVDYTVDSYNDKVLTPSIKKRADEIKAQIISGKIHVPDHYKLKK
jgi:basic membrane protein A